MSKKENRTNGLEPSIITIDEKEVNAVRNEELSSLEVTAYKTGIVTNCDFVNVRITPEGPVKYVLPRGHEIEVINVGDAWVETTQGFIMKDFIELTI